MMISEDEILYMTKEYLLTLEWKILSYKAPGGHGGITVDVRHIEDFSESYIVPDLIAIRANIGICMECKKKYSKSDHLKLNHLFNSQTAMKRFIKQVTLSISANEQNCRIPENWIKALAFSQGNIFPDDFVIFLVTEGRRIRTKVGKELSKYSNLLHK